MSELAQTDPPPSDPPSSDPPAPSPKEEDPPPVVAPKGRRSSSAAALQGADAEEVKKLSQEFGIVGEWEEGLGGE